jgi:hypothetical protein
MSPKLLTFEAAIKNSRTYGDDVFPILPYDTARGKDSRSLFLAPFRKTTNLG